MASMDCSGLYLPNLLSFYLAVVIILAIVSILTSGFIVTVNIRDWFKGKNLNPVDQILVVLGLSNTALSYTFGNYVFLRFLWPQFFLGHYTSTMVVALMLLLGISSSWLSAWLCFYVIVKIIHFKSSYLNKLKLTIDASVPWLIVFSEVVAFSSSLTLMWSFVSPIPHNSTSCNQVYPIISFQHDNMYNILVIGLSSSSALSIVLVSTVCIVWSLYRDKYQMKKTMSSTVCSQLRTHWRAAQTLVSILLIYIVYYVTYVLIKTVFSSNTLSISYWITVWVLQSTSPAMSLVLILGNSKLYLRFSKIFFDAHHKTQGIVICL